MQRSTSQLFAAVLAAPLLLVASTANAAADRAACGNIELAAGGSCEFLVEGGCTAECEPLNFTAACDGQCNGSIEASCTAECSADCEAECTVNPGSFDCQGSCEVDCQGSCDAQCSADADQASCSAYCQGCCKNSCSVKCTAEPPSADCKAHCEASCSGSCQAKADFDCSYSCSSELTGGCTTKCEEPEGALFCNGQYVEVTSLDDCIAYLKSTLDFQVDYEASGHCDASGCEGEAEANASCSAAPAGSAPRDVGAIAAMVMGIGLIVSRRRRA
jgi:MYXO-CTERM domain-containing protein